MAIGPLGPTASLLAALRSEVARAGKATKPGAAAKSATPATARRHDVAVLRKELKGLLEGVPPDDEEAMARVRVRVVRAVLLWEFGSQLREHSEWQPMLETLVGALEANALHHEEFAQLIAELDA